MVNPSKWPAVPAAARVLLAGLVAAASPGWLGAQPVRPTTAGEMVLPPGRAAVSIPASSVLVVVRRAYVLGGGSGQFCSPELSVFNQANKGVALLMVAAEYFQPRNGVMQRVGSTHTRFTVDPGETVSIGFHRLSTDSCDNVVARASVSACLWRDRSGCEDRVVFSDSGQIPLVPVGKADR